MRENAEKYWPELLWILTLFRQWYLRRRSRRLEKTESWKKNAKQIADHTWTESAKVRVLRALLPSCALVLLYPTRSRAIHASCHMYSLASRASCLTCSSTSCLVPFVASWLALFEPSFFPYPTVYVLIPYVPIPCDFWGEFTKVKANIVCQQYFEVAIIIYQQYDIFENIYIWNCKLFWCKWKWV